MHNYALRTVRGAGAQRLHGAAELQESPRRGAGGRRGMRRSAEVGGKG